MSEGFYVQAQPQPQQCCENRDDYDTSGATGPQQRQQGKDDLQRCVPTPTNHNRSIITYMRRIFPLRAADIPPCERQPRDE